MIFRLHLTRNLRSLAFVLVLIAMLAAVGLLFWANSTGLPQSWRSAIEQEVSKQGAYIKIGSLRYLPLRGVIATDVRVYSEAEHLREISRLERVTLDFDKTKLARGIFHLNKIQLHHARLTLPVDPKNPNSETLKITRASGTIFMPGERRIEIRNANGKIAGINFTLDARVIGYQQDGRTPPDDSSMGKRRALMAQIIEELEKWNFDKKQAPSIQIMAEGDLNDLSTLTAKLSLKIKNMKKNGHQLNEVTGDAEIVGDVITVNSLKATDAQGVFEGHIDYNLNDREGRFDLSSSLEVPKMLSAWLGIPAFKDVSIRGKQILEAEGNFELDEDNQPELSLTGHLRCESVTLRSILFDAVEGSFSWHERNLFIRDLRLLRPDGKAEGKVMIEDKQLRLELHTTLPVPVYRPFFIGVPLEIVLRDFTEREGAAVDVKLEGGLDLTSKFTRDTTWAYVGSGSIKNLNYKGVPVNSAGCQFATSHHELDFYDGTIVFNYTNYPLRKAYNGATEGVAKVARIRYDAPKKVVEVEEVRGAIWAAPMVRFFAPKIADTLEVYRFHQPPNLRASGIVDVTPRGRTELDVSFSSEKSANYEFLGQNVTLDQPRGQVAIRGDKTNVTQLNMQAFEGSVGGEVRYLGNGKLTGDLSWTKLALTDLASTYGFEMKGGGNTTGRIDFSLTHGKVETMAGEGLIALQKAELFSVPMFGPLTPLVSGVLNDEKAGSQRAKNAFFTYQIRDGILSSHDFQTSTTSLNFAGDGSINLNDRTVDMTMRMNARGLLGFITLPLLPFSGLFQFHGTGPLKDPKWESMKFSVPSKTQNEILLAPPKATIISEGE